MTSYARSANREREIIAEARLVGWSGVRSAGSHGASDVLLGYSGDRGRVRLAVQVKLGTSQFREDERQHIRKMARDFDALPILAWRKKRNEHYFFYVMKEKKDDVPIEDWVSLLLYPGQEAFKLREQVALALSKRRLKAMRGKSPGPPSNPDAAPSESPSQ